MPSDWVWDDEDIDYDEIPDYWNDYDPDDPYDGYA